MEAFTPVLADAGSNLLAARTQMGFTSPACLHLGCSTSSPSGARWSEPKRAIYGESPKRSLRDLYTGALIRESQQFPRSQPGLGRGARDRERWLGGWRARMSTSRLSALDASFLSVESPTAHMHVGWAAVFEPPAGERPNFEELRDHIAAPVPRA